MRKRSQNHFRFHFNSKTPYPFDTRGTLSTPASDVNGPLKTTTGKAIYIRNRSWQTINTRNIIQWNIYSSVNSSCKSPHSRKFATQAKKYANARGSARGEMGAAGIDWCIKRTTVFIHDDMYWEWSVCENPESRIKSSRFKSKVLSRLRRVCYFSRRTPGNNIAQSFLFTTN